MADSDTGQSIDELRRLIREQMAKKGGGRPQSVYTVSVEMGTITAAGLAALLNGGANGASVSTCIGLAYYLELPLSQVLTLAGHERIIPIIERLGIGISSEGLDPRLQKLANAIGNLEPNERDTVIDSAIAMANVLKGHRSPTIIGGTTHEQQQPPLEFEEEAEAPHRNKKRK